MSSQNIVILDAVEALIKGGTLLYPTDTIWGIGCDATNDDAVDKIYSIKQRDHSKSMLILCADIDMIVRYVSPVSDEVRNLLLCSVRPTTVILPLCKKILASNLVAADGTIGVRVPQMDFCQQLLRSLGKPIVSTSANLSGHSSPTSYSDIENTLKSKVDYCVPPEMETDTGGRSSRIVKLLPDGSLKIIRQ